MPKGRILALIVAVGLVSACTVAPPTPSLAPRLAHYTARVVVSCPSGELQTGSGVLIAPEGYVATAFHVVQQLVMGDGCTAEVGIGRRIDEPVAVTYEAQIITYDPVLDIALLRIVADRAGRPPNTPFPYAEMAPVPPAVGETVHVLGFPAISEGLLAYDSDTIISVGDCDSAETCWMLTEAFASWGSSGGPVFDSKGRLIGMTVGQRVMALGGIERRLTAARPVSVLHTLISQASTLAGTNLPAPQETRPASLEINEWQVEIIGPLGANWRSEPSTTQGTRTVLDVLPKGTILHVIPPGEWEGWWATADNRGRIGWVKEKATNVMLARAFLTAVTPRLNQGTQAVVTCLTQAPCAHVGYSPGYATSEAEAVIGSLAGGTQVDVVEGPYYVNGLVWWRVRADKIDGWLPEVTKDGYRLLAPLPAWK